MIKNTTPLTELEVKVLEGLLASAEGNGYDFGFVEDIPEHCGVGLKTARGVVSSLVKKDIITIWDKIQTCSGIWTQVTFNQLPATMQHDPTIQDLLPEGVSLCS